MASRRSTPICFEPGWCADFADLFPERFNNKTNGVTPRRWLLLANPDLSKLITEKIGDGWVTDLSQLRQLLPLADDKAFRTRFRQAKQSAKERFVAWLKATAGVVIDPNTIFDSQIKRIHEYKRQLLNVLHIVVLYNRLRNNPKLTLPPRTFFLAGKAAPAYHLAKLIIKLANNVARVIDEDAATRGRIKLVFLPNYNVSLAERLIPASDVSEQISTAGYEASGTGNMKFMMNGALTIGTRDGATIEMAEEAGEENFFLFGLTAEQVRRAADGTTRVGITKMSPRRARLSTSSSTTTSAATSLAFLPQSARRCWSEVITLCTSRILRRTGKRNNVSASCMPNPTTWDRKAIINVACSGKFSSDRTISEYASAIWNALPCPVD